MSFNWFWLPENLVFSRILTTLNPSFLGFKVVKIREMRFYLTFGFLGCLWPTFYQMDSMRRQWDLTKSRWDVQLVKKSPLGMVVGQQMKEEGHDQCFWHLTFNSFANLVESVNSVLWTSSIKYKPTFNGRTFISDAVVQRLSLLHSFAKWSPNPGSAHCRCLQIFDKRLKRLIYLGYWRRKHWKYCSTKLCKAEEVRKYFVNPKTKIDIFN